ncbi:hypothetical protein MCAP1_002377 [Malassezia caprae]|uniref:CTLH domain-containing protein n=1 Tax=Malassezia caprae TaxID=1381934 RepID=A0AAF0E9J7_9BASI|nr:hypothetical protein MCAP1_002377 [Malassezia caprae]
MRIQVLLLPDAYHAFEQANHSDLNSIVLQYLVMHGHEEAAEHLAHDAGLSMPRDRCALQTRSRVRDALLHGNVDRAVRYINEVDPEILDTRPFLFFELQKLRMMELLRQQQLEEALALATEELAPLAEEHPALLDELEKCMSLCLFDAHMPIPADAPAYAQQWLDPMHRLHVAEEVIMVLLTAQGEPSDAKLPVLLQYLQWGDELVGPDGPAQLDDWTALALDGAWPPVPRDDVGNL